MLKIARILIVALCCILICVLGTIYSFIRFKNPSNVGVMARWFGRLYPLFGLNVEHRFPKIKRICHVVFTLVTTKIISIW